MAIWSDDVEAVVRRALDEVTPAERGREHLGRPFITAYQLAIKVHRIEPGLAAALRVRVGGEGVGQYTSLAQYLALQLSRLIRAHGAAYFVEGAQLSSAHTRTVVHRGDDGEDIVNSNVAAGFDTTMFRLRDR